MPLPFLTPGHLMLEQEDPFELVREQVEAIALTTATLVSTPALRRHLREADLRLVSARGLEAKKALARDFALTNALLIYLRDVVELVA